MSQPSETNRPTGGWWVMLYATLAYAAFLASFGYFVLFSIPAPLPHTVDRSLFAPLWEGWPGAVAINLGLVTLFGLQHSTMARKGFKAVLTRYLPAPAERATYVLVSSAVLAALVLAWQPLPGIVWRLEGTAAAVLYGVNALAWTTAVAATFMIDHFDLFGLRQAWEAVKHRPRPPESFTTRWAYRFVRHPLQSGIFFGLWVVPVMSTGHLLLALGLSVYILAGTRLEERDLLSAFGERYRLYRQSVPMLIPRPWPRRSGTALRARGR